MFVSTALSFIFLSLVFCDSINANTSNGAELHFNAQHYEFRYDDLIQKENENKPIIENENISISIWNASSLSFLINGNIELHLMDNQNYHNRRKLLEFNLKHAFHKIKKKVKKHVQNIKDKKKKDDEKPKKKSKDKEKKKTSKDSSKKKKSSGDKHSKDKEESKDSNEENAEKRNIALKLQRKDKEKMEEIKEKQEKHKALQRERADLEKQIEETKQQILEVQNEHRKEKERQRKKEKRLEREARRRREEESLRKINELKLQNNQRKSEEELEKMKEKQDNEMQQEMKWEEQRDKEREERIKKREERMMRSHDMKLKEHKQLMDGLKGFLNAFGEINKEHPIHPKTVEQTQNVQQQQQPMMQSPQQMNMAQGYNPMLMNQGMNPNYLMQRMGWNNMHGMYPYVHPFGYEQKKKVPPQPPPLLPPIPPLPAEYLKKMPSMIGIQSQQNVNGQNMIGMKRRLLENEIRNENILESSVRKCLFGEAFGELCIEYDHKSNAVSFDITTL